MPNKALCCSFCGKDQAEVRTLIAGPSVFICDACTELCADIVWAEKYGDAELRSGIAADLSAIEKLHVSLPMQADLSEPGDQNASRKKLQLVAGKIEAAASVDQIMLEMSGDVLGALTVDRLIIYAVGENGRTLVTKIRTGQDSSRDLEVPLDGNSIAAYAGLSRRFLKFRDVYDELELTACDPNLRYDKESDQRAMLRIQQMLVAPVLDPEDGALLGILLAARGFGSRTFTALHEEGIKLLAQALAKAFKRLSMA